MKKKIKQAWKDTKSVVGYGLRGGDYGTRKDMQVSDETRLSQMLFNRKSPVQKAKKVFKVLYKHYSDLF